MSVYNTLGEIVVATEGDSKLDACCKALLSEKQFLAWILQSCEDAYKNKTIDEIIDCIEGEPEVGTIPVAEGLERKYISEKIKGSTTEDTSKYEGAVKYDIRFRSLLPDEGESELIVNVEAQNNFNPGYKLITRGIYYSGRMISSQKGIDFGNSNYSDLKKVHSIWICLNPDEEWQGTINTYYLQEKHLLGNVCEDKSAYDKIQVTMICLDNKLNNKEKNVISLLNIALANNISVKEKLKLLNEDFGIKTTEKLGTEAANMCNYSKGVFQKGVEQGRKEGIEEGRKEGIEEGRKEGIEEGRKEGINITISIMIEDNKDEDTIVNRISEKYKISTEEAKEYYNSYEKSQDQ